MQKRRQKVAGTAFALRNNKTKTIDIIVPYLISHFFSATISGIQDTAVREGYNVLICQSNESFETEVNNLQMMMAHRVDGILISLSGETKTFDHIQSILNRAVPLVFSDRVCEELNASQVMLRSFKKGVAYSWLPFLFFKGILRFRQLLLLRIVRWT